MSMCSMSKPYVSRRLGRLLMPTGLMCLPGYTDDGHTALLWLTEEPRGGSQKGSDGHHAREQWHR